MSWKIDTSHAQIGFTVRHMMISKVRGRFEDFDGTIYLEGDDPTSARVEGYIEAASINSRDDQRDAHLRSPDFLDAETYPRLTFQSRRIEKVGNDQYRVIGDLTIKDVTREVVFDVTDEGQVNDPWGNRRWGVSATTSINRKDYGLTWNLALETGGWVVGDEVKISAEMELVQVQPEAQEVAA